MPFLIDFLENIKVPGTRVNHYQLHVCHSMLLASKICNSRYCFAVGRPLLTGNRRPFPRRSRGVAIQSDSPATQRFHAGSLILDLAATTTASATVPLREFWKLSGDTPITLYIF